MNYTQLFETTIYSKLSDHALTFVSIPLRSFDEYYQKEFIAETATWLKDGFPPFDIGFADGILFNELDYEHSAERWIELIQYMYAAMLEYPNGKEAVDVIWKVKDELKEKGELTNPTKYFKPEILAFSKEIVANNAIPFEQSPWALTEITDLIRNNTGVGIGATMGFYVGQTMPPLLFITVPAGMIIGCATDAFVKELSPWLRKKFRKMLGVKINEDDNIPEYEEMIK